MENIENLKSIIAENITFYRKKSNLAGKEKSLCIMCDALDAGFRCEILPYELQTFRIIKDGFVEETPITEEPNMVEETEPVIEESTQVTEETPTEQPIIEESTEVVEEVQDEAIAQEEQSTEETNSTEEQKEVNVPTPIDANVIEEKPTPTIDDDDEDEDDFGYGEDYENSF